MFAHQHHGREDSGELPLSRNHAADIWACDFLQVTDLFFRPLAGIFHHRAQNPTGDPCWSGTLADRCLGGAYRSEKPRASGQVPKYLICDNDSKFGSCFARVATTSGIEILKTPYHAPRANAICERFAQECATRMRFPTC